MCIGVEADVDRLSLYLAPLGVFHQDADLSGFFIAERNADQS